MRLAFLASLSLLAPASAEFGSMFVERGQVPTFPGTTTYRIFATFDSPSDRVTALSGLPNLPLEFTSTGGFLVQDQPAPLGCVLDSLLRDGISGPADSFLTIRSVDSLTPFPLIGEEIGPAANIDVAFSPDVLCNADPPVSVDGSSWSTGDSAGGIISFNPGGNEETGQAVLLAQFTLPEADDFTFTGAVNYTEAGTGESLFAFFSINSAELPEDAMECDTIEKYLVILNSGTASDCNNNNVLDLCEANDLNDNGLADNCECIADINGDDRVDLEDIVTLLFSWGEEPVAGLAVNVDATSPGSENKIDQADLDAVMAAALGTGCEAEVAPLLSPASAPVQETRESSAPENTSATPVALDVALPLEVLALPMFGSTNERFAPAKPSGTLRTGQVPPEVSLAPEASDKDDVLENFLELLSAPEGASNPSEDQVDWDLDRDGLLDPWSVMILPLSSWPEELRPFAELLRP